MRDRLTANGGSRQLAGGHFPIPGTDIPARRVWRVWVATVLGAVVATLGAAPPAEAVLSVQRASVTATPDATALGLNQRPVSLGLRSWFDTIAPDLDQQTQFATVNAAFALPPDLVMNFAVFPTCAATTVFQNERQCPGGSQVGLGTGRIIGLGLDEVIALRAFNSPGSGLTLLVTGESPLIIREIVPMPLTTQADPVFPFTLAMALPRNLQSPAPGVIAALADFVLTFPVQYATSNGAVLDPGGNRIPFVANSGCTGFRYVADYTTTFDGAVNGGRQTVEAQASPCTGPFAGPVVPPRQGVDTTSGVVTGKVLVRLPSGKTVVLEPGASVPIGSEVNAAAGSVQLFGQVGPALSDVISGTFSKGTFTMRQARGAPNIDAVLPRPRACGRRRRASASRIGRDPTNTVKVKEHRNRRGGFRTIGGYSSASAIGTEWVTVDRCTSTTTKVTEGRVRVRDAVKHRSVLLRVGDRYTARAR